MREWEKGKSHQEREKGKKEKEREKMRGVDRNEEIGKGINSLIQEGALDQEFRF